MPFVLDYEECWSRPRKRRRLGPLAAAEMARTLGKDDISSDREHQNPHSQETQHTANRPKRSSQEEIRTSDREELIQCIKRGQRPTWVPKPNLEALCAETNAEARIEPKSTKDEALQPFGVGTTLATPIDRSDPIPRPPSALHAGDFRAVPGLANEVPYQADRMQRLYGSSQDFCSTSPLPWRRDDPYPPFSRISLEALNATNTSTTQRQRSRAPSLGSSLSSSFVMRVPTSPLVHATSSPASEPSEVPIAYINHSVPDKSARRRTLPSHSLSQTSSLISAPSPLPDMRRELSAPYRTHQVRRSLTSFTYQPATSSQTVFPSRHRRLSHASEPSSRHQSSMIGSFEESILRGRMSTPPSKPLDFVAQIGVLGKGNCPAKLKCPAHVSVAFPAVFYNYPTADNLRTLSDDSPSPYVGTIDLEANLNPVGEPARRQRDTEKNDPETLVARMTGAGNTSTERALAAQGDYRSGLTSSKCAALGGAYRVPQQGQLQVVIKNPNKTAVKLFLIPYDLEGMQPGSKTFVRQRSFSSGPVLEKPLSVDPGRTIQDPLSGKQILRYLIHLRFCCPAKGRFYLYDSIRVIFANRVPEGKEKLRNEVQLPEPKYSPFVPGSSSSRRQSIIGSFQSPSSPLPAASNDQLDSPTPRSLGRQGEPRYAAAPVPFYLSRSTSHEHETLGPDNRERHQWHDVEPLPWSLSSGSSSKSTRPQSPEVHGFDKSSTSQRGSPVPWASLGQSISRTSSPTLTHGDGLLSRKLRELYWQNGKQDSRDDMPSGS